MNSEIITAALNGAKVTVESDCWPLRRKTGGIVIHMTKQTWNGVVDMRRTVKIDELTGGGELGEGGDRAAPEKKEGKGE